MPFTARQIQLVEEQERDAENKTTLPLNLPRSSKYLFNRELSLIEFFGHVLDEGMDSTEPLLERLKFLSIFSSNLDEFFMIRVSGLQEETEHKVEVSPDGMTPQEQLTEIRARLLKMIDAQMRCLHEDVLPELKEKGIEIVSYNSLTDEQRANLTDYFKEKIYPILTPQAVDPIGFGTGWVSSLDSFLG